MAETATGDDTPDQPTELPKRQWWAAAKRAVKEFQQDNMTDWAASLTYYGVLSLFPGLIVLLSLIGIAGQSATGPLIDQVEQFAPEQSREILVGAIQQLEGSSGFAGPLAIIGLLGALWTASGYIGAFMRASNAIYEIDEGRPFWKTVPLRIGLTIVMVTILAICAIGIVTTGGVAQRFGDLFGIGETGVLIWDIAKWPVVVALIGLAIALLYWASPNVKHPGFRWLTPGSFVAILTWVVASLAFGLYVANFGSYNKTYGSLAGVIIFLVWLWISNIAILFGAEFDAELLRGKRIESGGSEDREPFLPPRDTRKLDDETKAELARDDEADRKAELARDDEADRKKAEERSRR